MTTQLESLRRHSVVVADTGDIDAVARWKPQDATTNPSLLLASAADPRYRPLLERSMAQAGGDAALSIDWLFVQFGREILKHIAGRVSTEVDARLSFDTEKSVEKARRLLTLYENAGVGRELQENRSDPRPRRLRPAHHRARSPGNAVEDRRRSRKKAVLENALG